MASNPISDVIYFNYVCLTCYEVGENEGDAPLTAIQVSLFVDVMGSTVLFHGNRDSCYI